MNRFWYFLAFVAALVTISLLARDPIGAICCALTGLLFWYLAERIDPFS